MSDNKILLDELRYKRNIEEVEKKQREKELNNAIKIIKQKKELIEGNELQKIKKRNRLVDQAFNDQKLYEEIIKQQIKEKEEEKIIEKLKKKTLVENGKDILRQIMEKKEKKKLQERFKLEEGRIMKQTQDDYLKTLERIKLQKLKEMEKLGIKPIYRVDLEKIKII